MGALIAALAEIDAGRAPEFGRAYDVTFARAGRLIGATLLALAAIALSFVTIIGIPLAFYLIVRWLFIPQAIILDDTTVRAAFSYSGDAVAGSWWRTFGIWLLLWVIIPSAASGLLTIPFQLAPLLLQAFVSAAVNAIILPFLAISFTLLYFDLQARKQEGSLVSTG